MTYDDQKLTALLAPMREHLAEIDERVERAEAELHAVRSTRNRLANAIRALDPPPKAEKKTAAKGMVVSEDTLDEVIAFLRAFHDDHLYLDGIWALKLYNDPRFSVLKSESGIRNAVSVLHDRGVLALDRVGQGGRRIYKVVTEA